MLRDIPQILLVDDNRPDLDLVQEACSDAGMTAIFHCARDVQEALQCLARLVLQDVGIDLIVLDLLLPGSDGFRLLEHLQSQERLSTVPVLVLSGSSDMHHVDRCFRLGAAGYLYKPVMYDDYRVIASRMGELLEQTPPPPRPGPTLPEREELLWSMHAPGQWAGVGG